jgi:hypothetical protein
MALPRETDRPFQRFGHVLREYRETYGERMRQRNPDQRLPRVKLTALSLIDHLAEQSDYHITSGTYSEIEKGITLPRDLGRFLEAVMLSLGIENRSLEYYRLMQQLAYDVVSWRVGEEFARQTVPLVVNMAQVAPSGGALPDLAHQVTSTEEPQ